MSIGDRIREDRKKKGLTLRQLAGMLKIDFTYLSKIENATLADDGKPMVPSATLLTEIAKVLGVDPDEYHLAAKRTPPTVEKWTEQKAFQEFFRTAAPKDISSEEWLKLADHLKNLRNRKAHGEEE